jgi:hypothetical protein
MAIKNLANYRVGQRFLFEVGNMGATVEAEILEKGDKKLRLKPVDGIAKWVSSDELTVLKSFNKGIAGSNPSNTILAINSQPQVVITELDKQANEPPRLTPKIEPIKITPFGGKLNTEILDVHNEEELLKEPTNDTEYVFKWLRWELRDILKKRGIDALPSWSNTKIIDALKKELPPKTIRRF